MNIYLESEIIRNMQLSDDAILVYTALRSLMLGERKRYLISLRQLGYTLTGQTTVNRYFAKELRNGLIKLSAAGYIQIILSVGKSEYILDLSDIRFETGNSFFVTVDDESFPKICTSNCSEKRILRYYLMLLSTLMSKDGYNTYAGHDVHKGVGYMSQSFFIENLNISQKSLYTYTSLLEEKELIYVHRQDKLMTIDGQLRSFSNLYGRYEDKDAVIEAGAALVESYHAATYKKKTDSDLKRLAGKFRYIRDSGKVYDDETMERVYWAMVEQNKRLRSKYFTDELYQQYKKDLSVFKEYPFYQGVDGSGNKGGDDMD